MKRVFLLIVLINSISITLKSQNWQWCKSQNFTLPNSSGNVLLSNSGNLVTYLSSIGAKETQIVFSNSNGDTIWKKHFHNLVIKETCIDVNDNIYFAGVFYDTLTIGSNTFISQGSLDAIVGKFNNNGILIKSKAFGTVLPEYANSIALSNNNIIFTGGIINSQMVDSMQLIGSGTRFDAFVIKLDSNFNALYSFETTSSGNWGAQGIKVAVDQSNSVYLIGNSEYTLSVGSTTLYISEDGQFFVKLTNNLQVVFAKTILSHWGSGYYRPFIFFDNSGNFVLSRVTGGGGGATNDLSVEKYNSACNQIWYQYIYVNSDYFVDMDNQYNIWAAGRHYIGANVPSYSVVKISSTGVINQIIYDQVILHSVDGLAVKANNDFYVIGDCSLGSSLDSYSCSPQGSVFMARYIYNVNTSMSKIKTADKMLNIYPNPTSGNISVESFIGTAEVYNSTGQLLFTKIISETDNNISLLNKPAGCYFIRLSPNKIFKVVKE